MRKPIEWDTLFLNLAYDMAEKSKDDSTQCGAVIVEAFTRNILSTGFNGPPPGIRDDLVPWNMRPEKYAYIIHAEENALLFALDKGGSTALRGSTVYTTHHPCAECCLRLIRSNVKRVVIPECTASYPLAKFQVDPNEILAKQPFHVGMLTIEKVKYERKQ